VTYPKTYAGAALEEIGREMRKKKRDASNRDGWKYMDPNQPRNCWKCGEPVRLNDSVGFKQSLPLASWHFRCSSGPPYIGEPMDVDSKAVV
jgi:hypothetical protein